MKSNEIIKQEGKLLYILENLYILNNQEKCLIIDKLCDMLELEYNKTIELPSWLLTETDKLNTKFKENS